LLRAGKITVGAGPNRKGRNGSGGRLAARELYTLADHTIAGRSAVGERSRMRSPAWWPQISGSQNSAGAIVAAL